MNKIVDYVIHSSLYVGFVGLAMVFTTSLLLKLPINFQLLLIPFLVSFSAYNINRKTDIKEDKISHPARAKFIKTYYTYLKCICIICYLIAFILGFMKNILTGIFIFLPALFVTLYSVPWISKFSYSRLKEIFLIKNFTVALGWSLFVTLLPLFYFEVPFSLATVFIFMFIFMKVFGNTFVFDIRVIKGDKIAKIKTIPIIFGISKTKKLLGFINMLSLLLIISPVLLDILPNISCFVAIVFIYTQFYISRIGKSDITFLTDVLADGEYIIMAFLALIGMLII